MAKRTGNIARVGELLAAGVSARALRLALISVHYRAGSTIPTSRWRRPAAAIDRLDAAVAALSAYAEDGPDDPTLPEALAGAREAFGAALDDDLNVSAGLAAVFDLVRDLNRRIERRSLSSADAARALDLLRDLDRVLGILPEPTTTSSPRWQPCSRRVRSRPGHDATSPPPTGCATSWRARGITVEDTRDGQRWRRDEAAWPARRGVADRPRPKGNKGKGRTGAGPGRPDRGSSGSADAPGSASGSPGGGPAIRSPVTLDPTDDRGPGVRRAAGSRLARPAGLAP